MGCKFLLGIPADLPDALFYSLYRCSQNFGGLAPFRGYPSWSIKARKKGQVLKVCWSSWVKIENLLNSTDSVQGEGAMDCYYSLHISGVLSGKVWHDVWGVDMNWVLSWLDSSVWHHVLWQCWPFLLAQSNHGL